MKRVRLMFRPVAIGYTVYVKEVLRNHPEIAERLCGVIGEDTWLSRGVFTENNGKIDANGQALRDAIAAAGAKDYMDETVMTLIT